MRNYVKRINQKKDKLSKDQLLLLIDDVIEENDVLNSIINSLSTGILIVDKDFKLLRHNTASESRLPYKIYPEEIENAQESLWNFIDDEEISNFFRNCSEKSITNSQDEFSIKTSGGAIRFISISISPLVHKTNISGLIILIRDITDKKNQDVLLHRMENLANLTNLAAGMAHEIKNPLGAISIHIQLLQKAINKARDNENVLPPAKFVENHIDIVNEEIEHLNKLVMDFLMAVRPVKAMLELKDPDKIIQTIVDFCKPEFNKNRIRLEFFPCKKNTKIMLDEKLFRDVIMNLAQNSLAAIKSISVSEKKDVFEQKTSENFQNLPEIIRDTDFNYFFKIENYIKENKYFIEISDNGCGMSEETVSKIFEPYFTTKANGTGLGMTMVYKIIKEFSGEIFVESKENDGTKFTIIFPIPQKDAKLLSKN